MVWSSFIAVVFPQPQPFSQGEGGNSRGKEVLSLVSILFKDSE